MKTLVRAEHGNESHANGYGGCHTRWSNQGFCSGVFVAAWLNAMGEDEELYGCGSHVTKDALPVTNGMVRANWLNGNAHIVRAPAPSPKDSEEVAQTVLAIERKRVTSMGPNEIDYLFLTMGLKKTPELMDAVYDAQKVEEQKRRESGVR